MSINLSLALMPRGSFAREGRMTPGWTNVASVYEQVFAAFPNYRSKINRASSDRRDIRSESQQFAAAPDTPEAHSTPLDF